MIETFKIQDQSTSSLRPLLSPSSLYLLFFHLLHPHLLGSAFVVVVVVVVVLPRRRGAAGGRLPIPKTNKQTIYTLLVEKLCPDERYVFP